MGNQKQRAFFAAFVLAGLMIVGAACGGSSSSGSESSSGMSSETTMKSSGSDSTKCADLFNKTDELSAQLDAFDTGSGAGTSADFNAMATTLESFTPDVPSAIRDDWKALVSGYKEYANALSGVNFSNLADPSTTDKLTKAAEAMEDPKFLEAYDNIQQWTEKNCPSYFVE